MAAAPIGEISHEKLAKQFERGALYLVVSAILLAPIAVVDLATGSLTADRQIDIGLLGATAMCFWSAFSLRRLAHRLRSGNLDQRATPARWARAVLSIAASLGFSAGLGYLLGGWVGAAALPSATTVLMGLSFVLGLRRRRRMNADAGDRER